MTTLCIDELSRQRKRRWGWPSAATHVPADGDCPVLPEARGLPVPEGSVRALVPRGLEPLPDDRGQGRLAPVHGKLSSSVG